MMRLALALLAVLAVVGVNSDDADTVIDVAASDLAATTAVDAKGETRAAFPGRRCAPCTRPIFHLAS